MQTRVGLTSTFDARLSHRFMCADVTESRCHPLYHDLSPSVQGHLISLKYLQQASGPDHRFIPYTPSIPPSLPASHQQSLPPSLPLLSRSNQIGSYLPQCSLSGCACFCVCVFVCSHIHPNMNKTCILSALYP